MKKQTRTGSLLATQKVQAIINSASARMSVRGVAVVAAVVSATVIGATAFAYVSDRPTFTSGTSADYVTFNSVTNNPTHGDERNFVLIREAGVGSYVDSIAVQPGKEYEVYSYFDNNASSSLNAGGVGVARGARLLAHLPAAVTSAEKAVISGSILADNAKPQRVSDEAYLTTSSSVNVSYVAASAVVHSNGAVNGAVLPASLFTPDGAYLGFDSLNGTLPGGNEYAGYVIYRIKIDTAAHPVTVATATTNVTELPRTGVERTVSVVIGLLLLTLSIGSYINSRYTLRRRTTESAGGEATSVNDGTKNL